METYYLWADGEVVHLCTTRPWTWIELWVDYGAFLLLGKLRHLAETFGSRLVCLLICWLGMTHGAHDVMRLWLLGTSYMVDLEDLMHWGAEIRDFDAEWDAYFQLHVWVWLERVTWCGGLVWDTLEWWSYNNDDALVATLGQGLCHDPTPTVVFQPLIARCGTTNCFLFTNTYDCRICLTFHLSYLVCVSQPSIINVFLYTGESP